MMNINLETVNFVDHSRDPITASEEHIKLRLTLSLKNSIFHEQRSHAFLNQIVVPEESKC